MSAQSASAQARPVFVDGQAQIVEAFADTTRWIREDLWVETEFDSDGDGRLDRVHVDVTRPGPTGEGLRVPVVYASSPYYNGTGSTAAEFFWDVNQELDGPPNPRGEMPAITPRINRPIMSSSEVNRWVPRGFAVVHSASPGTGLSQGCPTVGGINESLAPKAVIDWLNGRAQGFTEPVGGEPVLASWSTGKVGMTGTSYNGTLPVAAATTGVEGLEAIIPIAPNTSYYHYYRSNGLVRNPGGYPGEDVDVLFDYIHSGDLEMRPYCIANVREADMKANQDRVTGDYNDFWAGRDYLNAMGGFQAALLMSHGFNDWNVMPEHSWRIAEAAKAKGLPVQIYYHQGGHGGGPPLEMQNRWFTRYLYDVQNGVEGDPKAWIVREGDARDQPTPYDDYPNPAAQMVSFRPGAGGSGIGSLGQSRSNGIETLIDDAGQSGMQLGAATQSDNRLLYATPTLTRDAHISGVPTISIRVAANAPAANLTVYLVELPAVGEEGEPVIITRGWADPRNRNSLTSQAPLVPGEFVDLEFALQPDDQIVPAGKRIGLMIFASDQEFTLHPAPGTVLSIDLSGTELMLPVVGGGPGIAQD